jgi:predicted nuclease of predicted toxin-antitoxin system
MIRFYFDEHMPRSVTRGLVSRGFHITMAVDVGMVGKDDDKEHLPYATENDLVLVTFDRPFAGRTMSRADHAGVICLSEKIRWNIGRMIHVLAEFSEQHTPDEVAGRVFWLK